MEPIRTTAIVRNGRITVEVPAGDGTPFEVLLSPHPRHSAADVAAALVRIHQLNAAQPVVMPDPDTLTAWINEGHG